MTKDQIIEAIKALTEVIRANSGWLGSETMIREANDKIRELVKML